MLVEAATFGTGRQIIGKWGKWAFGPASSGRPLDQVVSIPHIGFKDDLTGRLRMLDMRWKVLGRAVNVSSVPAPGDAAI